MMKDSHSSLTKISFRQVKLLWGIVFSFSFLLLSSTSQSKAQSTFSDFPQTMITSHGSGPALYLGSKANAPVIGFVSEGVPLERTGPVRSGKARVKVKGSIPLEAYIRVDRLGLRVQKRGKIGGAPVYVAPGNIVRIIDKDSNGRWRIGVIPFVEHHPQKEWIGIYPPDRLGPQKPSFQAKMPREGEPLAVKQQQLKLFDRPDGQLILEFIISEPPFIVDVLKKVPGWSGVRFGDGPYLIGFLPAEDLIPNPSQNPKKATKKNIGLPERIRQESDYPLWKVSSGTELYFNGRKLSTLSRTAFARELNRYPETNEVDVFVALSDDMAIRAMVSLSSLVEKVAN